MKYLKILFSIFLLLFFWEMIASSCHGIRRTVQYHDITYAIHSCTGNNNTMRILCDAIDSRIILAEYNVPEEILKNYDSEYFSAYDLLFITLQSVDPAGEYEVLHITKEGSTKLKVSISGVVSHQEPTQTACSIFIQVPKASLKNVNEFSLQTDMQFIPQT